MPTPHIVPRGRQVFKGQLNHLISAQGMLYTKSCVWELEFTAHGACLQSVLFSRHEHSLTTSDLRGQKCPPSLPPERTVPHSTHVEWLWARHWFMSWRIQGQAPLTPEDPNLMGEGTTIQWVPTMTMYWVLSIYHFIQSPQIYKIDYLTSLFSKWGNWASGSRNKEEQIWL